ncbi:hypothetical protein EBZ80_26550, partial [bacterium]|nr:hypothetical protein [bacterium]
MTATTSDGNYTGSQATNFSITQKSLTVSGLTGANKVYDRTTAATATGTAALSGVESGDTVTLTGTPTFTFASANVGTGISISTTGYTLGGAQASNYLLTQPTLSANITAKGLTISGATATNRAYNGSTTVAVSGGSLVGVESGDFVTLGGSPTGTVSSAAVGTSRTVTVTGYSISGGSASNYSLTQPSPTVDITAKALTIGAPTLTTTKEYDGTTTAAV